MAKSFIKWVGGKTKILSILENYIPSSFTNYHEIFLGSGALFFYLQSKGMLDKKQIYLSDINDKLINTYLDLKENNLKIIKDLKYFEMDDYYKIRSEFNLKPNASKFIYLNKNCFNGLYRVNKKGLFNVPKGKYSKIDYNFTNLKEVSKILLNVNINCKDFFDTSPSENDFVYLDPPYYPITETSFVSYHDQNFCHEKLFEYVSRLNKNKVKFLMSNSYCDFNLELYKNYNIEFIEVNRFINSNVKNRGKIKEILVRNYE